jgi:hypothetical protein
MEPVANWFSLHQIRYVGWDELGLRRLTSRLKRADTRRFEAVAMCDFASAADAGYRA